MTSSEPVELVCVDILDTNHRQAFEQALMRVLQTEPAEHTFAEIIDGLPIKVSYTEFHWPLDGHPATNHHELCPGILEKTREFRSTFRATSLRFQLPLLHAFAEADIGSKPFHLRLIELLAVSCHQIAVYLCQLDGVNHKHHEYETWRDQPRAMNRWDSFRHPTAFSHTSYTAVEQYPNKVADVVGYWAEAKIFGGVVLFDRGESETECREVYLHAGRRGGPYTLFPPTAEQFERLMEFLLSKRDSSAETESPLPIRATSENRWRWDAWDSIAQYHIFRDKYERFISPAKPPTSYRSSVDWPEIADDLYLIDAMHKHYEGKVVDKEKIQAALERLKQVTPSSPVWHNRETRHSWTRDMF
ncbi:hypothetical protein EDB81DRAFT_871782 [Dactylonectria macrodidyma]|uniref:Uncharacterized protein n=1 Tax=Dactylonectria macrodidyma TaxID=307937 RepID=A0A9P9INK6_9HYPO|nr:hypothetical protein EDB81DRAFT_871782 [Dactylonectria macrodidyma]